MGNVKYQLLKVMAICWWVVVSGIWILGSLGAIATPAKAESKQIDLTISSSGNQTFTSLLQQAELLAENYVNQAFAENSETTSVSVRMLGERNGEQVPLLWVTVSRSGWQRKPTIQAWTKYYSNSELLLGFLHQEPKLAALQPAVVNEGAKETSGSHQEPNFYE